MAAASLPYVARHNGALACIGGAYRARTGGAQKSRDIRHWRGRQKRVSRVSQASTARGVAQHGLSRVPRSAALSVCARLSRGILLRTRRIAA